MTTYSTNTNHRIPNPLNPAITEAEDLLDELRAAARRLEDAIAGEAIARARAKDAVETLESAVSEAMLAEIMRAELAKEGPLAGIAKTSKAYDIALAALRSGLCNGDGQLAHLATDASRLKIAADNAKIALDQAQTAFSAVKHAADLKAMILRASVA